jgi:UDP-N-acetylglucosamine 2-epimerase (non-hydrolysing)
LRDTTERPEAAEAGTDLLVGTNENLIVSKALDVLNNKDNFDKMSKLHNPYGDGLASVRIVDFIKSIK